MMNLKYYLRGLGVGIIVTVLIMGFATGGRKETLSNEEIKERAKALGMIEEGTALADVAVLPSPEAAKEPSPLPTKEPAPTPTKEPIPTPTEEPMEAAGPVEEEEPMEAEEPVEEEESAQDSEMITIQVHSGDGSMTVSRKLEDAGLVDSAADFDSYLYQNGYDKRINTGIFEIPAGADAEQIARILAGARR